MINAHHFPDGWQNPVDKTEHAPKKWPVPHCREPTLWKQGNLPSSVNWRLFFKPAEANNWVQIGWKWGSPARIGGKVWKFCRTI